MRHRSQYTDKRLPVFSVFQVVQCVRICLTSQTEISRLKCTRELDVL